MRYDIRVSDGTRFELEQDEPLVEGAYLRQLTMVYKIKQIRMLALDESDEFDAVVEVDWRAGPAQAEYVQGA